MGSDGVGRLQLEIIKINANRAIEGLMFMLVSFVEIKFLWNYIFLSKILLSGIQWENEWEIYCLVHLIAIGANRNQIQWNRQ